MKSNRRPKAGAPCLCNVLRQASRAVTRLYDDELRPVGLRTTQFSLLCFVERMGEVRQGDLGRRMALDETTLTRNLRLVIKAGWVEVRPGKDRREKLLHITSQGTEKLNRALPAWNRAQARMRALLSDHDWQSLMTALPGIAATLADS
jgi:DNA-binding MarR family transcriptional regulator